MNSFQKLQFRKVPSKNNFLLGSAINSSQKEYAVVFTEEDLIACFEGWGEDPHYFVGSCCTTYKKAEYGILKRESDDIQYFKTY